MILGRRHRLTRCSCWISFRSEKETIVVHLPRRLLVLVGVAHLAPGLGLHGAQTVGHCFCRHTVCGAVGGGLDGHVDGARGGCRGGAAFFGGSCCGGGGLAVLLGGGVDVVQLGAEVDEVGDGREMQVLWEMLLVVL